MISFTPPAAADAVHLAPFFFMRPNRACESGVLDTFIWRNYYSTRCAVVDGAALLFLMENERETFSAMPLCSEKDLPHYFRLTQQYFNDVLKRPLKIYLADEEGVGALGLKEDPDYLILEQENLKDYLYDAEELRTLPGKKYHKKKNLISKFCRDYEGRWEYQSLDASAKDTVLDFLARWYDTREDSDEEDDPSLTAERTGLSEIFQSGSVSGFSSIFKMGGIFIDGTLSALSLGTENPREKMAVISIEKADPAVAGLYQTMGREFLAREFPDALSVNREDDVGLPGLRKSKLSYHPTGYERKYMVLQKNFPGYEDLLFDYYEEEIRRGK